MASFNSIGGSKFKLTLKELGALLLCLAAMFILDFILAALSDDWAKFMHRGDNPASANARMWILFLSIWLPWQTIRYVRYWRRKQRENPEGFDHMLTIVPELDDQDEEVPGEDFLDGRPRDNRPKSLMRSRDFN